MAVRNKFKYGLLAFLVSAALTGCGLDGDDGAQGETGAQGPQGEQGEPGTDGSDGTDASIGIAMDIVGRAFLGNQTAAEIVQYHAETSTIYATNGETNTIAIIDASGVSSATMADPINTTSLTPTTIALPADINGVALGSLTSIAISGDLMAVAVPAAVKTDNGFVLFYNGLDSSAPAFLDSVEVGALPDMVTFTPDGGKVLVANEGEPSDDYTVDPEGSVSVINILASGEPEETGTTVGFSALNGSEADLMAQGMMFPNPAGRTINGTAITSSVAKDLEPEYITATNDVAYISLQENNGLAILDLEELTIDVVGLGTKTWAGLNIDIQEDGSVSFGQYTGLYGVYQPDTIANFTWKDATFIVTANEGDAREYFFDAADEAACTAAGGVDFDEDDGCLAYTDEVKVEDLTAAANSELAMLQATGEADDLRVTSAMGDADGNGEYDAAYAYGARSFTIWDQNGLVVYDSGDDFERITASVHGAQFNNGDDENEGDSRSENKGPEPEALTVGQIGDRTYAFIGTERMGGIFVYDVTNPYDVQFAEYVINRDLTEGLTADDVIGDLAPESLVFVSAEDSPSGVPLLVVGNEVSGTVTVWQINQL
ncbi:choice-of-anchor I family protein [Alteromonas mediterranea]|jgi:choice-of-anchor I-like protein|uniref:choice-of-anchor I family protein n=1 Tax=Alteromonas mediterranea TaxID=314275 RepID=UPI00035572AD|nr:choice-of-anchor I family protein [Alteromonas mediterranea]AGP94652.1 alkaline phosphatase [Alteromonas mediterranea U8]MBR9785272.1 collagen-like protein [Gammaproteobacteria bacterium]MDY6882719.1 choice-of-anchor I family protein [Pseudomonadota bacterium]AGP86694.1 alkaline phosphatase [Alteromonas mediterranea U4]AGP90815.1 alkaline phosphatase [Alteromonas mediterranea U7]|tara:strand:+ start:15074 stop:16876 length:1803 start_codon:yes stop_codon:yes gene_type:complete